MDNYFSEYKDKFSKVVSLISMEEVEEIYNALNEAIQAGKQIFVFGNGGSATNMTHFATDMLKGGSDAIQKPIKVICLNDNVGLITAIGNDYSFDDVFYRQLRILANPGDIVFAASVSGSSPNLVKAFEWAKTNQLKTIALVGGAKGTLAAIASKAITIPSFHYGQVEDCHMMICHMIAYRFMEGAS